MTDDANIRMERIKRLLKDLEYEVTRGIWENEIDEIIGYRFVIPRSRKAPHLIIQAEFSTRLVDPRSALYPIKSTNDVKVVDFRADKRKPPAP